MLVPMVLTSLQGHQGHQGHQVLQDHQAHQDLQGLQAHQGHLEKTILPPALSRGPQRAVLHREGRKVGLHRRLQGAPGWVNWGSFKVVTWIQRLVDTRQGACAS